MFRIISIIVFVCLFAAILLHCIIFPVARPRRWRPSDIIRKLIHIFSMFLIEQKLSFLSVIKKLVFILAAFSFIVLAVTGFYYRLLYNTEITGYFLVIHVTFGAVLTVCLAILSLFWAENFRFDKNYLPRLRNFLHIQPFSGPPSDSTELLRKICFWLIFVLALPLILSSVLSMFKIFGTDWQDLLADIHRYTALAFFVLVIIYTVLLIRSKIKQELKES